jgi:hypothetical protein
MIKNRIHFLALILIVSASLACASGGGNANSPAETSRLQKFVQQAVPKLNTLEARHKEMVQQLEKALHVTPDKNYRYDRETFVDNIARMRSDLDNSQKDIRAMTIPKTAESFVGNIMQWIQNERYFLDKLETATKPENQEISGSTWADLSSNAQVISYQKNLLVNAMMKVSGATLNANADGK